MCIHFKQDHDRFLRSFRSQVESRDHLKEIKTLRANTKYSNTRSKQLKLQRGDSLTCVEDAEDATKDSSRSLSLYSNFTTLRSLTAGKMGHKTMGYPLASILIDYIWPVDPPIPSPEMSLAWVFGFGRRLAYF